MASPGLQELSLIPFENDLLIAATFLAMSILLSMSSFTETLAAFGAVAIVLVSVIVLLTLFFRALAWISSRGIKPESVSVRGVLSKNTLANVHLAGGRTLQRVRFLGFTNSASVKNHLPYELHGMIILEDEKEMRTMVRAIDIRMIVVIQDNPRPADHDSTVSET